MKNGIKCSLDPVDPDKFDWDSFLNSRSEGPDLSWLHWELEDRREDLSELGWLLEGIREKLGFYRRSFPDKRFERELYLVFASQTESLGSRLDDYERKPETCDLAAYLALKYEIRMLYKQLGTVVAGSDWQSPGIKLKSMARDISDEVGFGQQEQGTYAQLRQ